MKHRIQNSVSSEILCHDMPSVQASTIHSAHSGLSHLTWLYFLFSQDLEGKTAIPGVWCRKARLGLGTESPLGCPALACLSLWVQELPQVLGLAITLQCAVLCSARGHTAQLRGGVQDVNRGKFGV